MVLSIDQYFHTTSVNISPQNMPNDLGTQGVNVCYGNMVYRITGQAIYITL